MLVRIVTEGMCYLPIYKRLQIGILCVNSTMSPAYYLQMSKCSMVAVVGHVPVQDNADEFLCGHLCEFFGADVRGRDHFQGRMACIPYSNSLSGTAITH